MIAYDINPTAEWPYYRSDKRNLLKLHYYRWEYLLHGPLSLDAPACAAVKMQPVSLDTLEQTGLYRLFPALNTKNDLLAIEVRNLRCALSGWKAQPQPLLPDHIDAFGTLGRLFGAKFALPVTIAFLMLRRWEPWPGQMMLDAILDSFSKEFEGTKEAGPERLDWEDGGRLDIPEEINVVSEARQFQKLMQDLVVRARGRKQGQKKKIGTVKLGFIDDESDEEELSGLIGDIQLSGQESEAKMEPELEMSALDVNEVESKDVFDLDNEKKTTQAVLSSPHTPLETPESPQSVPDSLDRRRASTSITVESQAAAISLSATLGALETSAVSLYESFHNLTKALQPEGDDVAPPLPRDIVLRELGKSREALKSLSMASGRLSDLLGKELE